MKTLYTEYEYLIAKSKNLLPLQCQFCKGTFYKSKACINLVINKTTPNKCKFCSNKCRGNNNIKYKKISCTQCCKKFIKQLHAMSESGNNFCCKSCACTYNNMHKTHGTRRSKLEIYLEEQIRLHYPELKLVCNSKGAVNSELDFYFPDLKLAIELNGIFHYEPIYGKDKLTKIQNNDKQKSILCYENGIEFAIIDSSTCSYLTQQQKNKYWNIFDSILQKVI